MQKVLRSYKDYKRIHSFVYILFYLYQKARKNSSEILLLSPESAIPEFNNFYVD